MPLLIILLEPISAYADAIVVSQAMFASTIVEYFVEDDHVRVELEIGVRKCESGPTFSGELTSATYTTRPRTG